MVLKIHRLEHGFISTKQIKERVHWNLFKASRDTYFLKKEEALNKITNSSGFPPVSKTRHHFFLTIFQSLILLT